MTWTLRTLLFRQPTESQYEILQRADRMFAGARCGRFYGGTLALFDLAVLTDHVELREGTRERIVGA